MPRLLLKCDAVLAEQFCPLDPEPPYQPPDRWDAPHVQRRFAEAIATLMKLPAGRTRPGGYWNTWPQYELEWLDLLSRLEDGGEAYDAWVRQQNWTPPEPPTAKEISTMEAGLGWPGAYLSREPAHLAYALNAVGLARARAVELEQVVRRGKHAGVNSPIVWQQLALEAAGMIARGLRADCIPVF
jgi:hypothetical protein